MRLARRRASMKRQATQKLWCKSLYATHEFFSHVYCSMTNHETIGSSTKQVKDSLCVSDSSLVGCVLPTRLFFFFNLIWQSEQSVTSSYRPTPLISWRFSRFSARTINFGIFSFSGVKTQRRLTRIGKWWVVQQIFLIAQTSPLPPILPAHRPAHLPLGIWIYLNN